MRANHINTASAIVIIGMFLMFPSVSATVITVNPDGSYSTTEVKDYRQKQDETIQTESFAGGLDNSESLNEENITFNFSAPETLDVEIFKQPNKSLPDDLTKLEVEIFNGKDSVAANSKSKPKSKPKFKTLIAHEASKYDMIDEALIEAVIETESNFDVAAVSPKGAMGLMQLMPATATRHNVTNVFNVRENIRGGTAELAHLIELYNNPVLALAAYNAGEGAVKEYGGVPPYRETQEYVVKVLTKTYAKRAKAIEGLKTSK